MATLTAFVQPSCPSGLHATCWIIAALHHSWYMCDPKVALSCATIEFLIAIGREEGGCLYWISNDFVASLMQSAVGYDPRCKAGLVVSVCGCSGVGRFICLVFGGPQDCL